jgi:outer membrane protein TolC
MAAAVFFLGGCYSYKPPPSAISGDTYTALSEKAHATLPTASGQLSLEKAREIALANNPGYLATRHSMAAATARFHQSLSAYLPTITASYNQTENMYTPQSQGGIGRDNGGHRWDQKTGLITGRWTIFNGLMRTMDMLAALHAKRGEEALNRDARRLLIKTVSIAYNNVLLSRENIRIVQADEVFNTQLRDEAKLKFDAGAVPLSDVLNFEIRVNNARTSLIAEKYNFFMARSVLAELMGFTNGIVPEDIFPPLKPGADQFSLNVGVYLDTALKNRPDLKAFRETVDAAKYHVYSRWGAFAPTVDVFGSWGYQRNADGYFGNFQYRPRTQDRSFNYGFEARWVLFSGGERIARLREAQAVLAQKQELLTEKWIGVVAEVRQAYADLKRRIEQVGIYKETLSYVTKNRSLVEESYKAGNTSITRLNEAQRDLVTADSDYVRAIIDLENSKANLAAAVGVDN